MTPAADYRGFAPSPVPRSGALHLDIAILPQEQNVAAIPAAQLERHDRALVTATRAKRRRRRKVGT